MHRLLRLSSLRLYVLPAVVFAVGAAGAWALFRRYDLAVRERELQRTHEQVAAYLNNLKLGLASIVDFNQGLAAHVAASGSSGRRQFDEFVGTLEAFGAHAGLQSVGYAPRVATSDVARFGRGVQADYPGWSPHDLRPGARYVYPILHLSRIRGPSARLSGFDEASVPERLVAMQAAAATARPVATAPHESPVDGARVVVIFTPVYAATPRLSGRVGADDAVRGFVFSVFDLRRTLRAALGREFARTLDMEIEDDTSQGPAIYDDDGIPHARDRAVPELARFPLEFAGRRWTVRFFHRHDPGVAPGQRVAWLLLASGILLSALLAALTRWTLLRIRRPYTLGAFARNLHQAFEHHPFAVYYLDLQRRFVNVNRKALQEFGVDRQALLGMPSEQLIAPELRELGRHHWELALQGQASSYASAVIAADGRRLDVNLVLVPMMSSGAVAGVLGIAENTTERTLQEHELERSRQTLQSIIDNLPQVVFWKGTDLRIRGCNRRFAEFLGMEREQIVGRTDEELSHMGGEIDNHWIASYREDDLQVIATGAPIVGAELRVRQRDGSEFWARTSRIPLRDADGAVTGVLGVAENITERKMYELRLERLANHDDLTGLPNRGFFLAQLEQAVARTDPGALAVVYFDIDRFKTINDTWGHEVGDKVIAIFARRVRQALRHSDVVGRMGGDEFVFFSERISRPEIEGVCERLVAAARRPMRVGHGLTVQVSTSIGVAFHREGVKPDALLREADRAMYAAKAAGRNRVHLAAG